MQILALWLKAMRAPFFTASVIPVMIGAAIGSRVGEFRIIPLLFSLIIVIANQAGANLINDYYDASGSDSINRDLTPFSGGSKLIQQGKLGKENYLKATLVSFIISIVTAAFLTIVYRNLFIIGLDLAGIAIAIVYSATQTYGMGRGWGEIAVGIGFGPLATLGSFILQTNQLSWMAVSAGIPAGFLIMGVLILNEFPDYKADRTVGKRNWIVRSGNGGKGVFVYLATITAAYFTILMGVFTKIFPAHILISYSTIPLAIWIIIKIRHSKYKNKVTELIPAMAGNIGLHFFTGLLICLGIWWK